MVQTAVFKYVQEERTDGMKVLQDAVISLFSACSCYGGKVVVAVNQVAPPPRGAVSALKRELGDAS